jgi:hypothetical protein
MAMAARSADGSIVDRALREIRDRGLSAWELGKGSGVHRSNVDRWLKGERGLTAASFAAVVDYLGGRLEFPRRRK